MFILRFHKIYIYFLLLLFHILPWWDILENKFFTVFLYATCFQKQYFSLEYFILILTFLWVFISFCYICWISWKLSLALTFRQWIRYISVNLLSCIIWNIYSHCSQLLLFSLCLNLMPMVTDLNNWWKFYVM